MNRATNAHRPWALLAGAMLTWVLAARAMPVEAAGEPLPGLSSAHRAWFEQGRESFDKVYSPATGLGPIFNAASCVACHSSPVAGGGSAVTVVRYGRTASGRFDPLQGLGGPLLQAEAIDPSCKETLPPEANTVVERITTPTFGAGLVETVEDEEIQKWEDPDDLNGDGISGRARLVPYPGRLRVGRFGWKAQHATLLSFSGEALVAEMGVTNLLEPIEIAPNDDAALLEACAPGTGSGEIDDLPDAEGFTNLVQVTNFMRLLAPPSQQKPRGRGWAYFRRAGCAACHRTALVTGADTIPALDHQKFYPYSDFLLHDMGALGDGIGDGRAAPLEMRTAPLWGIGHRGRFLHDGRATTLREAIVQHDGEGAAARERFLAFTPRRQDLLLSFVASR